MGLQSPMESRKSEDARLQPAPEDGNATNLGREIYDRHLSMSSVAGPHSAAWQALRIETFGANRLPMLARLAQRWARVAILPPPKASAHEWYVAHAASPRTTRLSSTSLSVYPASPATSSVAPIRSAEGAVLSTPGAADSPELVHAASVVTASPDQKVEWGPPIFQAGKSLRTNRAQINRTRADRDEDAAQISSGFTIQDKQSPIRGDAPILRREAQQAEQLKGAEARSHSDVSGQLLPVHPVEPVEGMAGPLAANESERRSIAMARHESAPSNSANAEPAATALSGQTSAVPVSDSPISPDSRPVHLQNDHRISAVSLNEEVPVAAVPLQHVTRIARKAMPLIGNNNKEADERHLTPILRGSREAIESQTHFSKEDARPGDGLGAPSNVEVNNAGQSSTQSDAVQATLEGAMTRPSDSVETSAPSALSLITSPSPRIATAERSHLQRDVKHVPAQNADAPRGRSEGPVGSHPVVATEAVSLTPTHTIAPSSVLPGRPKATSGSAPVAPSESAFVPQIESSAQVKIPAVLMRTTHHIHRVADLPAARESETATQGQGMDLPNSEAAPDFRAWAGDVAQETTTMSSDAKLSGELTYLDRAATEPAQVSLVDLMDQSVPKVGPPHPARAGAFFRKSETTENRKSPELAAERTALGPSGDSSNPVALDCSVSRTDNNAVLRTGAAALHREPRALETKVARLAPFVQRTPAQEIYRSVAAPNVASLLSPRSSAAPNVVEQSRLGSRFAPVIQTNQMAAFPAAGESAHLQRAVAAARPPDAIEASVPLPFASASGRQTAEPTSGADVGQIADRVYHMLVDRLASERARRGM